MAARTHLFFLAVASFYAVFARTAFADDGTATFYTPPYTPSACNGFENDGIMIAAASDEFWNNGEACGQVYIVKCTGATNAGVEQPCRGSDSIQVKIVDYCPTGCRGTIDLSQEVFAAIADPAAGKIKIEYHRIS